jgi:hypothetical protein
MDRDFLRYSKTKIVTKIYILASRRILDDYNQSTGIATDTTASHSVSQSETDCVVPPFPPPEYVLQSPFTLAAAAGAALLQCRLLL